MKNKSLLLLPSLSFTLLLTSNSFSQPVQPADPGISVFNYKHLNKAEQARKNGRNGLIILENSFRGTSTSTFRKNKHQDYTPKYKPRENAFVIYFKEKKRKMEINPLTSSQNYKTGRFPLFRSVPKDSVVASI